MSLVSCVHETVEPPEQLALLDFVRNLLLSELVWPAFTLGRSHLLQYMVALVPFLFPVVIWAVPFAKTTRFPSRAWGLI